MPISKTTPVIWHVLDDRAGHRSQVLGLTDAIARRLPVDCHDVVITPELRGHRSLFPGAVCQLRDLPPPDLLIGAGHRTHLPLLSFRRYFGGRAVVLMKPTIPLAVFDLAIVSSVDKVGRPRGNLLITEGPLNRIQPSPSLSESNGLILIGGASSHFEWSDKGVLDQLAAILTRDNGVQWTLTTSRRTPPSFLDAWRSSGLPGEMIPCEETPAGWVPQMLQQSGRVWVTCESMSMIYESLTAGAAVGLLELPEKRRSRVVQSAEGLIKNGFVAAWSAWRDGAELTPPPSPLCEADRCADELIQRFLSEPAVPREAA